MFGPLRTLLLGTNRRPGQFALVLLGLFAITVGGYALGFLGVERGVVFVPEAVLVGVVAATWVGYTRRGLLAGWLAVYATVLGALADHAFLAQSDDTLLEGLAYFLSPDGLVYNGVVAVIFGTIAFAVGWLAMTVQRAVTDA